MSITHQRSPSWRSILLPPLSEPQPTVSLLLRRFLWRIVIMLSVAAVSATIAGLLWIVSDVVQASRRAGLSVPIIFGWATLIVVQWFLLRSLVLLQLRIKAKGLNPAENPPADVVENIASEALESLAPMLLMFEQERIRRAVLSHGEGELPPDVIGPNSRDGWLSMSINGALDELRKSIKALMASTDFTICVLFPTGAEDSFYAIYEGQPDELRAAAEKAYLSSGQSLAAYCYERARSKFSLVKVDAAHYSCVFNTMEETHGHHAPSAWPGIERFIGSIVLVPLIRDHVPLGLLQVSSPHRGAFDRRTCRVIEIAATYLSLVIGVLSFVEEKALAMAIQESDLRRLRGSTVQ
jgi:hypothetical protein